MKVFITGGSGFIGINLINSLEELGYSIVNYDILSPPIDAHKKYWFQGDIMDLKALKKKLSDFKPDWVIHLAARTDCDENTTVEDDYQLNTKGTANVLEAVGSVDSVRRLIITSTQYVCGPGRQPKDDSDYFPHTVYGHSKVETEKLTRSAELDTIWTIIRPVNIWGPHHQRYSNEFWRIASAGLYLHPDVSAPTRTYGYIGNVIWQMLTILNSPEEKVNKQVFYVGDDPIQIDRWSIGFFKAFRGKDPIKVPMKAMKILGYIGDVISVVIRRPFFITSSRLNSMTEDYISPVTKTKNLCGDAPYSLENGIEEVVNWYQKRKDK